MKKEARCIICFVLFLMHLNICNGIQRDFFLGLQWKAKAKHTCTNKAVTDLPVLQKNVANQAAA